MDADELKAKIKSLLEEIEYVHLKKVWPERLIAAGISKREAQKWAAEIGHIVNEYERSLRYLVDLLYVGNPRVTIPEDIESWAAYTRDIGVFTLENSIKDLQEHLKTYLPPNPDEEDESAT